MAETICVADGNFVLLLTSLLIFFPRNAHTTREKNVGEKNWKKSDKSCGKDASLDRPITL